LTICHEPRLCIYLFWIVLFDKTWIKRIRFLSGSLLRDDWA